MNKQNKKIKIIISGGGTGGHIFPAIAIANALMRIVPSIEILFVGALNKMEMEKVPAAGYKIVGLPIIGFPRKLSIKHFSFFFKLWSSLAKARKVLDSFKPDVAVGVGGFASGPLLRKAVKKGIPSLIQEQNSYPGVTNKLLAKKVNKICVAYENMETYFPREKIIITGNPIRQDLQDITTKKEEGLKHFGLYANKKIILVVGGSLGALTINESILFKLDYLILNKIQLLWQTGSGYYETAKTEVNLYNTSSIIVKDFISRMDLAYAIADTVISRAGAITISELCAVQKPAIFIPSPNVAEDHQTKNAMTLIKNDAGMMIPDDEARSSLVEEAVKLVNDDFRINVYKENIGKMAIRDSADRIAREILEMVK